MRTTPKELADADQAFKLIVETTPPHLWQYYRACVDSGFTDDQSMRILLKHMETILSAR